MIQETLYAFLVVGSFFIFYYVVIIKYQNLSYIKQLIGGGGGGGDPKFQRIRLYLNPQFRYNP